jgi:hypothetical protein
VQPKITPVDRLTVTSSIGVGHRYSTFTETALRLTHSHLLMTKAATKTLIDFFNTQQGRYGRFWVPSWVRDVKFTAGFNAGDTVVTVENIDYENTWKANRILGRYLFVLFPDNSYVISKINKAPTPTTLQLKTPLGVACTADEAAALFACFLYFVRFDVDELELTYHTAAVAETELTFKTLHGEEEDALSVTTTSTTTTTSTSTSSSTSTTTTTAG